MKKNTTLGIELTQQEFNLLSSPHFLNLFKEVITHYSNQKTDIEARLKIICPEATTTKDAFLRILQLVHRDVTAYLIQNLNAEGLSSPLTLQDMLQVSNPLDHPVEYFFNSPRVIMHQTDTTPYSNFVARANELALTLDSLQRKHFDSLVVKLATFMVSDLPLNQLLLGISPKDQAALTHAGLTEEFINFGRAYACYRTKLLRYWIQLNASLNPEQLEELSLQFTRKESFDLLIPATSFHAVALLEIEQKKHNYQAAPKYIHPWIWRLSVLTLALPIVGIAALWWSAPTLLASIFAKSLFTKVILCTVSTLLAISLGFKNLFAPRKRTLTQKEIKLATDEHVPQAEPCRDAEPSTVEGHLDQSHMDDNFDPIGDYLESDTVAKRFSQAPAHAVDSLNNLNNERIVQPRPALR